MSARTHASVVGCVAALSWLPAAWAGFVADDHTMLNTVEGVDSPLSVFAENDLGQRGDAGHFYRPLWVLWNGAIETAFGADGAAFHLLNIALFALTAVLVYLLASRLLERPRALVAGLAFALYPRHGESVAWVSGNTDMLATALGLGALLALLADWPRARRIVVAAALTSAAALAKEAAFVLPILAAALLLLYPDRDRPDLRELRLRAPLAMAAGLLVVLVARTVVLGGTGGYADDPVTPGRVARASVSYVIAAVTPHELEVLRYPVLLVVPLVLLAGLAWVLLRLELPHERRRVLLLGHVWFALGLVPVLGIPLDLNTATGERLMFLPSIGLALALAAAIPEPTARRVRAALALAGVLLAGLSLNAARSWVQASDIGERVVEEAARMQPAAGRLTLLSIPESYRHAHVFTNSFDAALRRRLARDADVSWCVPVIVRDVRSGQIRFEQSADGYVGTTTWSAPFDFPVSGEPGPLTAGCSYARVEAGPDATGMELRARARPEPAAVLAYFDGERLVRVRDPRR